MFAPQSLQRFNDFLLIHLQRIGDHTRGLFEAQASIVVSAAHALQDVEIVFLSRHVLLTRISYPMEVPWRILLVESLSIRSGSLAFPRHLPRRAGEQKSSRDYPTRMR